MQHKMWLSMQVFFCQNNVKKALQTKVFDTGCLWCGTSANCFIQQSFCIICSISLSIHVLQQNKLNICKAYLKKKKKGFFEYFYVATLHRYMTAETVYLVSFNSSIHYKTEKHILQITLTGLVMMKPWCEEAPAKLTGVPDIGKVWL